MQKTLIYYMPEYGDLAKTIRDNYIVHHHGQVDLVSEEEQDDIEYARRMQYDEAIFIEDENAVIIHDIESGFTERLLITDVLYRKS